MCETARKNADQGHLLTAQKGNTNVSATSTAMKQGPSNLLDSLRDKAHQLLKKLTLLYKKASEIDSAYNGTVSLMKGWTKSTNSTKRAFVEKFLDNLESIQDSVEVKSYKDKIANFRHNEQLIVTNCQQNLNALCEALESDVSSLSSSIVMKSKKLSQLKVEMEKMEPGRQIPAKLMTDDK